MNNIPLDPQYIFYGDYRQESGYNLTKEILSLKEKPTAIFVSNNLMTLGCINALFESNYKIPDDMSLISFDRIDLLNILGLKISHINGPSIELGRIGMNLLLDSLQKPEDLELKKITLTPELVLLGSEKLIK